MKRIISTLALTLVLSTKAFALFGVGDIVFDPTAFGQLLQQYAQEGQQLNTLGNIFGINTAQLTSLSGIQASLGVSLGDGNSGALSLSSLSSVAQGLGIDPSTINSLYQQTGPLAGSLDVFMGTSLNSFMGTQSPIQNFSNWATNQSMGALGISVGLGDPSIQLATTVGNMPPDQQVANQSAIAGTIANLQSQSFNSGATSRRTAIQTESNIAAQAQQKSDKATTLNEQAAAGSAIAASNARLQALSATQQNQANETLIAQTSAQNTVLTDMQARRAREEAQAQLDARIDRND
jgi:hypothetical protein